MRLLAFILLLLGIGIIAPGCVRRTISITCDPPGALLWLNGREIGRTPVDVDFLYYGIYDVQLVKDGYEPLLTTGEADAPWWDIIPLDLVSEAMPGDKRVRIQWHYTMQPRNDDQVGLLQRARDLRQTIATQPAAASQPSPAATMPATPSN